MAKRKRDEWDALAESLVDYFGAAVIFKITNRYWLVAEPCSNRESANKMCRHIRQRFAAAIRRTARRKAE